MQLGTANPLRQPLNVKPLTPSADEDRLFCWNPRRDKMEGRMSLVLCNSTTRRCEATDAVGVTRTRGCKSVAAMNRLIDDVYWDGWEALRDCNFQHLIAYDCNYTICHCAARDNHMVPCEAFSEDETKLRQRNESTGSCSSRSSPKAADSP